jgi:large subunit ribosomal protein L10
VDRAEKRQLVSDLNAAVQEASVIVVAHYQGLNVAKMTDLRRRMRDADATLKVAKNRLVKIALEGTDAQCMADLMTGQTVLAFSADPVAAPKVASDFAKENDKFVILGGAMGATALDEGAVKALATMPSLDELRAKILGTINAPASQLAQVVAAPGGSLARVLQAKVDAEKIDAEAA